MNLLSLKSWNFSPFGPVTSGKKLYFGGACPLAYRGGAPKNLWLKARLCVTGCEEGPGGDGWSSSMMDSRGSTVVAAEPRRLRLAPFEEWRAVGDRSTKSGEPTKLRPDMGAAVSDQGMSISMPTPVECYVCHAIPGIRCQWKEGANNLQYGHMEELVWFSDSLTIICRHLGDSNNMRVYLTPQRL